MEDQPSIRDGSEGWLIFHHFLSSLGWIHNLYLKACCPPGPAPPGRGRPKAHYVPALVTIAYTEPRYYVTLARIISDHESPEPSVTRASATSDSDSDSARTPPARASESLAG